MNAFWRGLSLVIACVGMSACKGQIVDNRPRPDDAASTSGDAGADAKTDAPPDGPVLGRSCKDLRFCDNFEADTIGGAPTGWTVDNNGGTVAVTSSPPPSGVAGAAPSGGTKAVRLLSTSTAVHAVVRIRTAVSFTPNAFFGRARFWFTRLPLGLQHYNLLVGWGYPVGAPDRTPNSQNWYEIGGGNGHADTLYLSSRNSIDPNKATCCDCCLTCGNGPTPFPLQKWTCVEWQMDGVKNEIRLWVDGKLIDPLTIDQTTFKTSSCGTNPWIAPVFERMDIGWDNAPPEGGQPMEMWVDDVAFDAQRIGCGP